ncbi:MAG: hypothetical protein JSW46_17270 [Gemmatimonadota bacterium]|nr:MAG: hypothetical protein JSW46_17270 [Gemmatimonadota bacterium]
MAALLPLGAPGCSTLRAQQAPGLRILERQVRLTLDEGGDYRVIDAMRVRLDVVQSDPLVVSVPLPLIVIQQVAVDARGLGGDVSPRQVVRAGNQVAVIGAIPRPTFEVGVTYRLPPGVEALVLSSAAAVDTLSVFVDRGRIAVRPEGILLRREDKGPASQPSLNYVASDLPEGSAVRLTIISRRTGWRERLAVLIATLFAAAVAGVWAWRRSG